MNTGTRLGLYGAGLVVAFGGAFGIAGAVVPEGAVMEWTKESPAGGTEMKAHGEEQDTTDTTTTTTAGPPAQDSVKGLAAEAGGYLLSPVQAPGAAGEPGTLDFRIQDTAGNPVTEYRTSHEQDLHLIVVRADGSQYRHIHPALDESTGMWSAPWEWAEAGSYRVFADFTPAAADAEAGSLTLTQTVQVAGDFAPVVPQPTRVDEVDGFTVSLDGGLATGSPSELSLTVTREGGPVTTLEPYLGAFGHLVALREDDLAYLHVHAEGEEPASGQTSGPQIRFAAQAPTAGRYLLYLDFQVDGQVHTAEFVLDAPAENGSSTDPATGSHSGDGH